MGENRSLLTVLGSILGLVLLIYVIMQAVTYYQEGANEYIEMQRQAGVPILLSETMHEGEGTTAGANEEITATVGTTETAPVVTTEVTATTEVTTTTAVTATTAMTATDGITATVGVTATSELTATSAVTTTSDVTTTAPVTSSASVTATALITEVAAVDTAATVTTTESVSETVTVTESATTVDDAGATEAVALIVPPPAEVAPIFTKAGCIGCHVIPDIPGAAGVVGPNLSEIGAVAATRVPGLSALEYIHQSILEPNSFIVAECPSGPCLPGLMIQNLGDILTPAEIDAVAAYLASLGVEQ